MLEKKDKYDTSGLNSGFSSTESVRSPDQILGHSNGSDQPSCPLICSFADFSTSLFLRPPILDISRKLEQILENGTKQLVRKVNGIQVPTPRHASR